MSKIPEGATHTAPNGTYRMARGSLWHGYADGDWVYIEGASPHFYTKIQAEPEWNGERFPPVGKVIEFQKLNAPPIANGEWTRGDVRYLSDCTIVIGGYRCEHIHHPSNLLYRPAKTDEQIAAEKRDAAIKEMQRLVGSCNTFPFAELYDYGYRLQVEK
ncbi:MAG: hypothetical protein J6A65_12935 [Pseudomonas sp.]|nr:hypothetical protein [Pseudomonas sp.]MBP3932576.1 hypothetical protein [Pseudomonas sp.]